LRIDIFIDEVERVRHNANESDADRGSRVAES
jgi:hypothetical protein